MANRCSKCGKTYDTTLGLQRHQQRSKSCGGKQAGGKRRKKTVTGGRDAIHEILRDHPQGLSTTQIFAALKERGFNLNSNYICQAAAADKSIIRIGRGQYRLKANAMSRSTQSAGTQAVAEAVTEATRVAELPREALLLRIETLENQLRAMQDAHMSFIRGTLV